MLASVQKEGSFVDNVGVSFGSETWIVRTAETGCVVEVSPCFR